MPIPKSKPRQTGPKSDSGKKKASINALQHGATASLIVSQTAYDLAQSYEKELLTHYKPSNPLVKLQIQRIATTRAKLSQLYEQEEAKLALVYKEFEENPQKVMDCIQGVNEFAVKLALTTLKNGSFSLPRNLTPEQIKVVAKELSSLKNPILTDEDIQVYLPKLFKLLPNWRIGLLDTVDPNCGSIELLKVVSEDIEAMIESGNPLSASIVASLKRLLDSDRARKDPVPEWSKELQDFVEIPIIEKAEKVTIDPEQIKTYLQSFINLDGYLQMVPQVLERFKVQHEMMRKALSLTPEETDRYTRHQTTLERRLSTQIGELRVMLSSGGPDV